MVGGWNWHWSCHPLRGNRLKGSGYKWLNLTPFQGAWQQHTIPPYFSFYFILFSFCPWHCDKILQFTWEGSGPCADDEHLWDCDWQINDVDRKYRSHHSIILGKHAKHCSFIDVWNLTSAGWTAAEARRTRAGSTSAGVHWASNFSRYKNYFSWFSVFTLVIIHLV